MRILAGLLGVLFSGQAFAAGVVCEVDWKRPTMLLTRLEVSPAAGGLYKITYQQKYVGPGGEMPAQTLDLGTKHRCVFGDLALFACDENPLDSRDRFNSYVTLTREIRETLMPGNPKPVRSEEFVVQAFNETTRELARQRSNQVDNDGRLRLVFLKGDCQRLP